MGEPSEERAIGSSTCLCGRDKHNEQVVCFSCFLKLGLKVKYMLASLKFEVREDAAKKALAFAGKRRDIERGSLEKGFR
jgi:hypothetical protein